MTGLTIMIVAYLIGALVTEALWSGSSCESCGGRCTVGGVPGRIVAALLWLPILAIASGATLAYHRRRRS